jgi:hypothetical protein
MYHQTQGAKIIAYLKKNKFITSRTAIQKFWITRLSAVIFELKEAGFEFDTSERDEHGFVKYRLIK